MSRQVAQHVRAFCTAPSCTVERRDRFMIASDGLQQHKLARRASGAVPLGRPHLLAPSPLLPLSHTPRSQQVYRHEVRTVLEHLSRRTAQARGPCALRSRRLLGAGRPRLSRHLRRLWHGAVGRAGCASSRIGSAVRGAVARRLDGSERASGGPGGRRVDARGSVLAASACVRSCASGLVGTVSSMRTLVVQRRSTRAPRRAALGGFGSSRQPPLLAVPWRAATDRRLLRR